MPVTTQQQQAVTGQDPNVLNSVEFKDVGVILEVTPRVNLGGRITLELRQEVSEVNTAVRPRTNPGGNPAFIKRNIESTVTVQSGETLVLGGLISENKTESNSGYPVPQGYPGARGSVQHHVGQHRAPGANGPDDPPGRTRSSRGARGDRRVPAPAAGA